jgi:hypothetical protein
MFALATTLAVLNESTCAEIATDAVGSKLALAHLRTDESAERLALAMASARTTTLCVPAEMVILLPETAASAKTDIKPPADTDPDAERLTLNKIIASAETFAEGV